MPRTGAHASEPLPLADLLRDVVSIPTASYLETGVREYIREFAEQRRLEYAEDAFGNAYVRYQRGRARRPLVLGAHMDHPGFVVTAVRARRVQLEFRGGLGAEYGKGEQLRLYGQHDREDRGRARIASIQAERGRIASASAQLERGADAEVGDLALWDVTPFRLEGDVVHARSCDDLAGCAAVLATLDRAWSAQAAGTLIGLFTRAEEIGLRGASVAGRQRLLPEDALVVAVETSSMAGGRAEQGAGPIVRVGDALHIFSPRMTQWMTALCQELAAADSGFRYQRRLMDGGVTEATSYDLYGYETGAACIALGNYHNAGPHGKVAAETVHLGDLEGLVRLFMRMLETGPKYERYLPELLKRYDRMAREAGPLLRRAR
jgi:endoglucanase